MCQSSARVHNMQPTPRSEDQASSRPAAECHTQSQCASHGESTSVGGMGQPIRGLKSQSQSKSEFKSTFHKAADTTVRGGLQAEHVCHSRVSRHARRSRANRITLCLSQTHCR